MCITLHKCVCIFLQLELADGISLYTTKLLLHLVEPLSLVSLVKDDHLKGPFGKIKVK